MKRTIIIIDIMLIALAFSQTVYKTGDSRLSPRLLNYQGYLTDTQGNPITGSFVTIFSIYDVSSGGNLKWTENQVLNADKGIFHILLGAGTPIPDSVFTASTNRWLELNVAGIILSPRTQIVSAPYAYTAMYSDTARYARASAPDNDWTFRVTDVSDTTLQMAGQWGIARAGNVLYGNADRTHTNFGVSCTTGTNGQNFEYCTVSGGFRNKARSRYATVAGGYNNTASIEHATVSGGYGNTASYLYATANGLNNTASYLNATVRGGCLNTASNQDATVSGGYYNASGLYATVAGGYYNDASVSCATVGGGCVNDASDQHASVGGGQYNTADTLNATVGGGYENIASGRSAAVGGGYYNTASGQYATVAGGDTNYARGYYATASGGYDNYASDYYATIGGGHNNAASDSLATVSGGYGNVAGVYSATVGGGQYNTADTMYASVAGGYGANATHYGEQACASGYFAVRGDAQTSVYVLRRLNTGELFLDNSTERLTVGNNRRLTFDIMVLAGDNSSPRNSAGYRIYGVIENDGGTTAFIGTPTVTILGEDVAGWDVSVTADDFWDALVIYATGAAVRWRATVRTIELNY